MIRRLVASSTFATDAGAWESRLRFTGGCGYDDPGLLGQEAREGQSHHVRSTELTVIGGDESVADK